MVSYAYYKRENSVSVQIHQKLSRKSPPHNATVSICMSPGLLLTCFRDSPVVLQTSSRSLDFLDKEESAYARLLCPMYSMVAALDILLMPSRLQ